MVAIVLFLCVIRMGIFDNSHKRNVTYHKIPSVPELKKLWLQWIRREETSGYLSTNDIKKWIFKMALRLTKRVYNALQTLGQWLRHVCLCIVLMHQSIPAMPIPPPPANPWALAFFLKIGRIPRGGDEKRGQMPRPRDRRLPTLLQFFN